MAIRGRWSSGAVPAAVTWRRWSTGLTRCAGRPGSGCAAARTPSRSWPRAGFSRRRTRCGCRGMRRRRSAPWPRRRAAVEGPLALLRAATSVNAELLGRDDLGRIGRGAAADLLVLEGDPLRDPSVLWGGPDRRAVFQAGIRVAEQGARLVL